jgi:rhamnulokinase
LAQAYRLTLEELTAVTGRQVDSLHMVGGGCRNALLCRRTAWAAGLPLTAGPVEATAVGNLLVQALARGHLGSPGEIREVVCRSFDLPVYEPGDPEDRDEVYERFQRLRKGDGHG